MRERVLLVGDEPAMVGVLTEPESSPDAPPDGESRPAVILLNAGHVHRVGPNRINVKMARGLAEVGVPTLRIDLSGLGDSGSRQDDLPFEEGQVRDTLEAMDTLADRLGTRSFVLGGLCSGADVSFRAAVRDERVVGLLSLDGYAYRTVGYYLRHYGRRLFRPGPWKRFLKRNVPVPGGGDADGGDEIGPDDGGASPGVVPAAEARAADGDPEGASGEPSLDDPYEREFPPREQVCRELQRLVDRGVEMLFIYTAGQEKYFNGAAQFGEMFSSVDFGARARVEYFEASDHTFTLARNQRRLLRTVRDWGESVAWNEPGVAGVAP